MAARWNSPRAEGIDRSAATLPPPPDWPKTRTLPGSPPKRRMFFFTHSSARTISSIPTFPEEAKSGPDPARWAYPRTFSRWVTLTTTTSPARASAAPWYILAEPDPWA